MEYGLPSMKSIKSLKSLVKKRNNAQEVVSFVSTLQKPQ